VRNRGQAADGFAEPRATPTRIPGVEGDSVDPIETGKRLWRIEPQAQAAMERRIAIIAKRQLSGDGQPMTTVQHRRCDRLITRSILARDSTAGDRDSLETSPAATTTPTRRASRRR